MASVTPVRVLLVDDDPLVREGLRLLLRADDLEIVGEAADGEEAVAKSASLGPDVVLMDIRMPGLDGLGATEAICARPDPPAIIVLTTFDADDQVARALRAGAAGFLLKDTPPTRIISAIHRALDGDPPLSPAIVRRLISSLAEPTPAAAAARDRLARLTDRERAVADAIGEGCSNAEIAERLYLSVATVKAHVTSVLSKLEAANRVQVALTVHEATRR